ncbi:hypothetical protein FRC06_007473 [Ceratobasidium sp. 370]|nr:hypothetical protein FRC06_007473 [Ceratobasidium sp. 370]
MDNSLRKGDFSPFQRTFNLPELVHIICSFLKRRDYVNLLYLSHDVYACILPLVWEETNLKAVLSLIPETGTPSGIIDLPSAADLTRLNIYTPWVKTLTVSKTEEFDFPDEQPRELPQPLLPNLRRLIINLPDEPAELADNWLSRLLNPELSALEMGTAHTQEEIEMQTEEYLQLDLALYCELFEQVHRACPRIKTLQIIPVGDEAEAECGAAYGKLAKMIYLQSVTLIVSHATEELIYALGQLPHLEKLSLRTSRPIASSQHAISVPEDLFPSLHQLTLFGLGDHTIGAICKVSPLFHHLTQANIIFDKQCYEDDQGDYMRSVIAVEPMGRNSLHLQDLTIHPRGNYGKFVACLPVINMLKHLPLRSLGLGAITFDPRWDGYGEGDPEYDGDELTRSNSPTAQWTAFLTSVTSLQELHLERQNLGPEQLELIASLLPNLHLLEFRGAELGEAEVLADGPNAPQPIILRSWSFFRTEEKSYDTYIPCEEDIFDAARSVLCALKGTGALIPD